MSTLSTSNLAIMATPKMPTYWGLREVARYCGVTYSSIRTYHGRAEINRRASSPKPGDLPPPDARFGQSPVWYPETIIRWVTVQRPGKGAGGGRPPKKAKE